MISQLRLKREQEFSRINIYPVVTEKFCKGRTSLEVIESILSGGAKCIQLREKHISDLKLMELAFKAREITEKYNALLIIDDRVDIALACNADGVHLGTEDLPVSAARKIAPDIIIGTSTHNHVELKSALEMDISYLNAGPVFSTNTKETGFDPVGVEYIKSIIPTLNKHLTVMGGIKMHHLSDLKKAGVKTFALVTALTMARNPGKETEAFIKHWESC